MRFHTKDFVRGLLTRVLYTGKIAYYGKGRKRKIESVYPGRHPALISDETFQALTDLRKTVENIHQRCMVKMHESVR
jgi:hypothetical protein